MTLNETIKAIEGKGYIVKASANTWMGKLNEACPVVYEICTPDYIAVYGANGIHPLRLATWSETLPQLTAPKAKQPAKAETAEARAIRQAKEKDWDEAYNEGAEGYNPYRQK